MRGPLLAQAALESEAEALEQAVGGDVVGIGVGVEAAAAFAGEQMRDQHGESLARHAPALMPGRDEVAELGDAVAALDRGEAGDGRAALAFGDRPAAALGPAGGGHQPFGQLIYADERPAAPPAHRFGVAKAREQRGRVVAGQFAQHEALGPQQGRGGFHLPAFEPIHAGWQARSDARLATTASAARLDLGQPGVIER